MKIKKHDFENDIMLRIASFALATIGSRVHRVGEPLYRSSDDSECATFEFQRCTYLGKALGFFWRKEQA